MVVICEHVSVRVPRWAARTPGLSCIPLPLIIPHATSNFGKASVIAASVIGRDKAACRWHKKLRHERDGDRLQDCPLKANCVRSGGFVAIRTARCTAGSPVTQIMASSWGFEFNWKPGPSFNWHWMAASPTLQQSTVSLVISSSYYDCSN